MIRSAVAAAVLAALVATPAHAAAHREHWSADWEGTEAFDAGEGPCVAWSGRMHEARAGGYDLVTAPGGQAEGEFHVNGIVAGHVELVPDDATLPSYRGDYREKVNGVVTGYDEQQGDVARVMQFRLRLPLTGTDGSQFVLTMSGRVTLDAHGRTVVERESYDCVSR